MRLIPKHQNSNGKLVTLPKETQRVLDIQSKQPLAPDGDSWLVGIGAGIRNSIGGLIGNVARRIIFNKQKKDYYSKNKLITLSKLVQIVFDFFFK